MSTDSFRESRPPVGTPMSIACSDLSSDRRIEVDLQASRPLALRRVGCMAPRARARRVSWPGTDSGTNPLVERSVDGPVHAVPMGGFGV